MLIQVCFEKLSSENSMKRLLESFRLEILCSSKSCPCLRSAFWWINTQCDFSPAVEWNEAGVYHPFHRGEVASSSGSRNFWCLQQACHAMCTSPQGTEGGSWVLRLGSGMSLDYEDLGWVENCTTINSREVFDPQIDTNSKKQKTKNNQGVSLKMASVLCHLQEIALDFE